MLAFTERFTPELFLQVQFPHAKTTVNAMNEIM